MPFMHYSLLQESDVRVLAFFVESDSQTEEKRKIPHLYPNAGFFLAITKKLSSPFPYHHVALLELLACSLRDSQQ